MIRFEWLKSVWAIVAALIIGTAMGMYAPTWSGPLVAVGRLYISFLIMCVPPIVLTAVSVSLARLVMHRSARSHIRKMLIVFVSFMAVVAALAVLAMHFVRPGSTLGPETEAALGQMLRDAALPAEAAGGWANLFLRLIPTNIFAAMVEGNYPQILFVAVVVGLLLGNIRTPAAERGLELGEYAFKTFQSAISWSIYALPFAVVGIVARQVADTGFEIVFALVKLLATGIGAASVMFVGAGIVTFKVLRIGFGEQWTALRRSIAMGFATSTSMAVMPLLMDEVTEGLRLPRQLVNLVVPLSVLIARNGNVLYGGLVLMFSAQLYGLELGTRGLLTLIGAVVVGSVIGAGMPTTPYLAALTVVADPMGIPIAAVIPIFVAIMPILDPFGTAAGIALHAAATAAVIGKPEAGAIMDVAAPMGDGAPRAG